MDEKHWYPVWEPATVTGSQWDGDEVGWMRKVGVQFRSLPRLQAPSGVRDEVGWMRNMSIVVYSGVSVIWYFMSLW